MQPHDKNAILFSRTVKAGKRVYYIDVKQDRRGGFYLSLTESKRVQNATEMTPPVIEKHKIFLYSEDFDKFRTAFDEAVNFIDGQAPAPADLQPTDSEVEDGATTDGDDFRLNVDFDH